MRAYWIYFIQYSTSTLIVLKLLKTVMIFTCILSLHYIVSRNISILSSVRKNFIMLFIWIWYRWIINSTIQRLYSAFYTIIKLHITLLFDVIHYIIKSAINGLIFFPRSEISCKQSLVKDSHRWFLFLIVITSVLNNNNVLINSYVEQSPKNIKSGW